VNVLKCILVQKVGFLKYKLKHAIFNEKLGCQGKETAWRYAVHGGDNSPLQSETLKKKAIWKTQMYREGYTTVSSRNMAINYGLDSSDSGERKVLLFYDEAATIPSGSI
jgi:hypothetical protein